MNLKKNKTTIIYSKQLFNIINIKRIVQYKKFIKTYTSEYLFKQCFTYKIIKQLDNFQIVQLNVGT